MLTLANALTGIRIILTVFLWPLIFLVDTKIIAVILFIAGITDFLDGYFARKLHQASPLGEKFDSFADNFLGLSVFFWFFILLPNFISEQWFLLLIVAGFVGGSWLFAAIKYKRNPEYHLWSDKAGMVMGVLFFLHALLFGYNLLLWYLTMGVLIIMSLEEMAVTFTEKELDASRKTFFRRS